MQDYNCVQDHLFQIIKVQGSKWTLFDENFANALMLVPLLTSYFFHITLKNKLFRGKVMWSNIRFTNNFINLLFSFFDFMCYYILDSSQTDIHIKYYTAGNHDKHENTTKRCDRIEMYNVSNCIFIDSKHMETTVYVMNYQMQGKVSLLPKEENILPC